jgi:hypothetical protein
MNLLDNPLVTSILFYPRRESPGGSEVPGAVDGSIPVHDEVSLGYRYYPHDGPTVLYFHGNGEIAGDYDGIAPEFHRIGAGLLVVDYRGYGWSTGKPRASNLLSDVEAVHKALPDILKTENPLYIMGRSLGSAPAIHYASLHPETFKGIIIESGFAHAPKLLANLGLPAQLFGNVPDPIGNVPKMKKLDLPLLVIHGERDTLIPVANGQVLYDASPSARKNILRIPNAGHNDLLYVGMPDYFAAIAELLHAD